MLSVAVHVLVVLLVLARGDVVHPRLVVQIPADSFVDTLLELETGAPAQLAVQFRSVYRIAKVVARAVRDVGDEAVRIALRIAQDTVHGLDDDLDKVDVLPLVETAYVVSLGHLAPVEDEVDRPRVVLHIQPVANVLALAVHR